MKRYTLLAVIGCLIAAAYGLLQLSSARTFQTFGSLVSAVPVQASKVALTFDDGPTVGYTEAILSVLRERDVRATFFLTGGEVERNPAQAKQIIAEGHEVGNHSYSHPRLVLKSPATIRDEVERTDAAIRAAGYNGEILFRPPYGRKLFVLPWYLAKTGRTTIMWDIEPETYPDVAASAENIVSHVQERVQPGSIILLHLMYEVRAESRKALPLLIDSLRQQGYTFVTVSELLAKNPSPP